MDRAFLLWWSLAFVLAAGMWLARHPIRDLLSPDPYLDDPYHWAVGHIGHFLVGAVVALLTALSGLLFFGEYPDRVQVALMASFLIMVFEVPVQGWTAYDTKHDLAALHYGLLAALCSGRESEPGRLELIVDPVPIVMFLTLLIVHLILGAAPRRRARKRSADVR